MKKIRAIFFVFISVVSGYCGISVGNFPVDFNEKVFGHIQYLSVKIGERVSGTSEEAEAADYIRNQLESAGINAEIEKFTFETYQLDSVELYIFNNKFPVKQIYFNPYDSVYQFTDCFLLTDSYQSIKEPADIKKAIIITKNENDYFSYIGADPEIVLVVDSLTYKKIQMGQDRNCTVSIHGKMSKYESQNVIGQLNASEKTDQYIILSAHYDSYPGSPGADDNASGVGTLIELAKYFKSIQDKLNVNLKFISFGSEEKGILGSRVYLNRHGSEMKDCVLMCNMDFIGGPKSTIELLGGVKGIPDSTGQNNFPLKTRNKPWEGIDSSWRILASDILPVFGITNKPDWLVNMIRKLIQELNIQIMERGVLGSDQQTFTQAGVVTTSIGASGNQFHNSHDTIEQIHRDSLQRAGLLTSKIILETMKIEGDKKEN